MSSDCMMTLSPGRSFMIAPLLRPQDLAQTRHDSGSQSCMVIVRPLIIPGVAKQGSSWLGSDAMIAGAAIPAPASA